MRKKSDAASLRLLCTAMASSGFDTFNRIKSIAQVAHEYLGTSSIVVYAYNRVTGQLDVVAMPGVTQRELMRGPTDKLGFCWEPAESEHGRNGVWLDNDEAFASYLAELDHNRTAPHDVTPQGNFRTREKEKEHRRRGIANDDVGELATAKIYLWKGLEQTGDKVGQIFFNFYVESGTSVFDDELKSTVWFLSDLIRELLVDCVYHQGLPSVRWTPEHLLREINNVFDQPWMLSSGGSAKDNAESRAHLVLTAENELADKVREAALSATENYGGYADFILLVGRRLGRLFDGHPDPRKARTVIIPAEWISDKCIEEEKFFVGNDIEFTSQEHPFPSDGRASKRWPREIESAYCRSLMVVPVRYAGEVKAIIRLTSPRVGCFLDAQARAMRTLQQLAQYGLLRLDEWRQRERVSSALDFYTSRMSARCCGNMAFLMGGVLSALGAEWGTFWPIDYVNPDGTAQISHGVRFEESESSLENGTSSYGVRPDDPEVGIRGFSPRAKEPAICDATDIAEEKGFSQVLIQENAARKENVFFSLNVLKPREGRYPLGNQSEYYLRVFTQGNLPGWVHDEHGGNPLPDGFRCGSVEQTDRIGKTKRIELSANTTDQIHTRIAFVVSVDGSPKALVWLKFPGLHEVPWWERRYILGLSNSLGRLLQVDALEVAVRSFRHMIPSLTHEARASLESILTEHPHGDLTSALKNVENYIFNMASKCQEVKAVLASVEQARDRAELDALFETRSFDEYVNRAIDSATGFAANRKPWKTIYTNAQGSDNVNGLFYCVLLILLKNVVLWGWREYPEEKERAFIWIRREGDSCHVSVANTGNPLTEDARKLVAGSLIEDHGVGLRVAKTILQLFDGDIRNIPRERFARECPNASEGMKACDTYFEFHFSTGG